MTKKLKEGFKRFVYWNEYKLKIVTKKADGNNPNNRLFVLTFGGNTKNGDSKVERDSHRKYFLPTVDITKYNVLIDGRNFYDQAINDQIKKYDEMRKIATGQGDDYKVYK